MIYSVFLIYGIQFYRALASPNENFVRKYVHRDISVKPTIASYTSVTSILIIPLRKDLSPGIKLYGIYYINLFLRIYENFTFIQKQKIK